MAKQMQALSNAGIVVAFKGKTGGYALARASSEITLWDITSAIEGSAPAFRCTEIRQAGPCAGSPEECVKACPIAAAFAKAEQNYRAALREVSVADILAKTASSVSVDHMRSIFDWYNKNTNSLPILENHKL
jgi:Rrf2 family protein